MIQTAAKKRLLKSGITEEEIEKIGDLPTRKLTFGGTSCKGAIDLSNNRVYILDEKNQITGKVVTLPEEKMTLLKNSFSPSVSINKSSDSPSGNAGAESLKHFEKEQSKSTRKNTAAKTNRFGAAGTENTVAPKVLLLSCGICLVVGILFTLFAVWVFGGGNSDNDGPLAENQRFVAVQVVSDIIPGEVITEDIISKVVIDGNTYNQAALNNDTLYSWDDAVYLIGLYASEYVPAGECLTYNSVAGIVDTPTNPFLTLQDGYAYLDIPVNLSYSYIDSVVLGRYLDLTLEVKTLSNRTEQVETEEVPGLEHSSSITAQTTTDIYKLRDVAILDMTAADGSSLFETLSAYNAIPDGELQAYFTRYVEALVSEDSDASPEELLKKFTIATIRIQLPAEQVKAIGSLDAENTSVKIYNITDSYIVENTQQQDYLLEARFTTKVLADVFDEIF